MMDTKDISKVTEIKPPEEFKKLVPDGRFDDSKVRSSMDELLKGKLHPEGTFGKLDDGKIELPNNLEKHISEERLSHSDIDSRWESFGSNIKEKLTNLSVAAKDVSQGKNGSDVSEGKEKQNDEGLEHTINENQETRKSETENINEINKGLTEQEKKELKDRTGWSDEIIDNIYSMKEAEIYIKAGLREAEINGKKCLIRSDIDWDQKDIKGRTNRERVNLTPPDGPLSPINKDGKTIELHHIGQHQDSPFAELTMQEHRGKDNYSILHDTAKEESEINRTEFGQERKEYWQARAEETENGNS